MSFKPHDYTARQAFLHVRELRLTSLRHSSKVMLLLPSGAESSSSAAEAATAGDWEGGCAYSHLAVAVPGAYGTLGAIESPDLRSLRAPSVS